MIADYSAKIKIVIFQWSNPFRNDNVTNEDLSSNCVRIAAKIARFNVTSDIIGQKFAKFGSYVAIVAIECFESAFTISQSVVECLSKE